MREKLQKLLLLFCLMMTTLLPAQQELPIDLSDFVIQPLRTLIDHDLETKLAQALKANPKWSALIQEKKTGRGFSRFKKSLSN